jgi:hypothetical protein
MEQYSYKHKRPGSNVVLMPYTFRLADGEISIGVNPIAIGSGQY